MKTKIEFNTLWEKLNSERDELKLKLHLPRWMLKMSLKKQKKIGINYK